MRPTTAYRDERERVPDVLRRRVLPPRERDQALEVRGHPLLLALDCAGELGRLAVGHALCERLNRGVRRDLLRLLRVLGLGVLEQALLLAGSTQRVHGTLKRCRGLASEPLHGLRIAAELLDSPLDPAGMVLRLAQVLLQALLVWRAGGHADVGLERRLELLLLAVGLVQVLHQLGVTVRFRRHWVTPSACISNAQGPPIPDAHWE